MEVSVITTAILGGSGLLITYIYNRHNRKLANDRMHKELFTEFNKRYDQLNNTLFEIADTIETLEELKNQPELKSTLNDFFNLCSEEYYWYKKKRIDKTVWISWQSGMNYWYNNVPVIKEAWKDEIKRNGYKSFYLNPGENFFNS